MLGRRGAVILILLLGLGLARADTSDFTGDFAAAFWTNTPSGLGSASFTNSSTELVIVGPASGTASLDGMKYNEALGGGLAVGGTVQFNYAYTDLGDEDPNTEATLAYTPADTGGHSTTFTLGQGVGTVNGSFNESVEPGSTLWFLLSTTTPSGKPPVSVIITDFQFHPNVPEPSAGAVVISALIPLGAACWRRCWRWRSDRR